MHDFLSSVGFKNMNTQEDLDKLLQQIVVSPSSYITTKDSEGCEYAEYYKEFADSIGILVCGRINKEGNFRVEYYTPCFRGHGVSTDERVDIQKHAYRESYAGVCDEVRLGVTLIFYLQNAGEYLSEKNAANLQYGKTLTLSGLSVSGKIILPIQQDETQKRNHRRSIQNRSNLVAAAREGDEDAIEYLTLEDIDTYSVVSQRILFEDILSVVDTSFMPYGVESDQYTVIGEILDCNYITNSETNEKIWIMTIDTNGLIYDVCINQEDLLGEPQIGRRFKGNLWMQGRINYSNPA